jgi:hypothetical protein
VPREELSALVGSLISCEEAHYYGGGRPTNVDSGKERSETAQNYLVVADITFDSTRFR